MRSSSRGVLFPDRLPEFHRLPVEPGAAELVAWIWLSRWQLPAGQPSRQRLIGYPALNLVVEDEVVGLSGPPTRAGHRDLVGTGWAVGALLRPAAVAAFTADPTLLRDRYQTLDEPLLQADVASAMADPGEAGRAEAAQVLAGWVADRVGEPTPEALLANRLAVLAEDPSVRRVGDLAERLAVSQRTLQRLARDHIGLSPAMLIRRRRLQEAAERLRVEPAVDLAALAAELGYADQAHLTNDFARVLGFTPAGYRRSVTG